MNQADWTLDTDWSRKADEVQILCDTVLGSKFITKNSGISTIFCGQCFMDKYTNLNFF